MKRLVMMVMVLVMMAMVLCGCNAPKGEQYAMTTVVVELDENNDEVICIDFNGNEWVFEGVEDWMVGDIASMVMNDCGTPIIYDDENHQWEFPADNSDPTYVYANIDTSDIPAGEYRYRVVITMAADDSTYILNMADHIIVRR